MSRMDDAIAEMIQKSPSAAALREAIVDLVEEAESNGLADSYGRAGLLENVVLDVVAQHLRDWASA